MRAIAIIPARLASTRLPRKPLRSIAGRAMIEHVYRAAAASPLLSEVIVATDAAEIYNFCQAKGMRVAMTSLECRSGTDRIREVAQTVAADVYVNVQGDEPLARSEHIAALLGVMGDGVSVGTLRTPLAAQDAANPNVVKVVTDFRRRALYFSRSPIPYDRDGVGVQLYKHLGFYAYRKASLDDFCRWPEAHLERVERLEQLRFLENGTAIYVADTPYDTVGVDTDDDVKRVEAILKDRAPSE